jgi:glycosyltransferase involved in cell wall biosynthesis
MIPATFAIPGDIGLPTGGYGYDRRVLALLGGFGIDARHLALPASFPFPTAADLSATASLLQGAARQPEAVLMVDGLAYGAMPAALIDHLPNPILALVHHPLCLEAGLPEAQQTALRTSETAALARARHVVVTSPTTGATLAAEFGVPPARITVAPPGTDPVPRARGSQTGTGAPLRLLAVGSVVPRKAYDTLVRALAPLRERDWRLVIVGPTHLDAGALSDVHEAVRATGLSERITLAGPASAGEMAEHYATADVLVSASLYEGYGMALAEALAHGLPIVCTTGGAAAQTVPDAAAVKLAPGDTAALTEAIARVLDDADLRRRLSDAAWAAGQTLPRWEDTARIVADVIRGMAPGEAVS